MKLSSILSTLALGLGLASATGIEQEATLKSALRGRIEEASPFANAKTEWRPCIEIVERKVLSVNCDKQLLPKQRMNAWDLHSYEHERVLKRADSSVWDIRFNCRDNKDCKEKCYPHPDEDCVQPYRDQHVARHVALSLKIDFLKCKCKVRKLPKE